MKPIADMLTYIIKSLEDYETFLLHSVFEDSLVMHSSRLSPDKVVYLIKRINIQLSTINVLDYKNQIIYYSYTKLLSGVIHYMHYAYIYHMIVDEVLPMVKLKIFNVIKCLERYKDHHDQDLKCVFDKAWFLIINMIENIFDWSDTKVALNDCIKNDENKSLKKQAKNVIRKSTNNLFEIKQLPLPKCLHFYLLSDLHPVIKNLQSSMHNHI